MPLPHGGQVREVRPRPSAPTPPPPERDPSYRPPNAFRRWRQRRFDRLVARVLDRILQALEHNPKLRKHVRQTLRVKGYES